MKLDKAVHLRTAFDCGEPALDDFLRTRAAQHQVRRISRTFVLADGIEVLNADLKNGLLSIDLARPEPERVVKTIAITDHE